MAGGRLLRQLIRAGAASASGEFRVVAEQVIREERDKKHHLLANDLEKILYGENGHAHSQPLFPMPDVPTDRERKLPLLEIREPVRSFEDIILSSDNRQTIENTLLEQGRRDLLGTYGLKPVSRLLLCGPPGCGKTLAAEVLATELGLPLLLIRFDAVVSSFLGETAANLRKVFDYLDGGRYLALFDEFDAIGKEREDASEHGELRRVVSGYLQMMDSYRGNSLIVAASNHEGMLDRALWRRFDEVLFFERPTDAEIPELLKVKLRGIRSEVEFDTTDIIDMFRGMAHADIERVLIRSIKSMVLAGREFLTRDFISKAAAIESKRRPFVELQAG